MRRCSPQCRLLCPLLSRTCMTLEHLPERGTHSTACIAALTGAGDQPPQVLIDTIDALSEPLHEVVQRPPGRAEADRADVRAVALYLFAQLYIRQAQRADAMDVWPSSSPQAAAAAAAAVRPLCVACNHSSFQAWMPFATAMFALHYQLCSLMDNLPGLYLASIQSGGCKSAVLGMHILLVHNVVLHVHSVTAGPDVTGELPIPAGGLHGNRAERGRFGGLPGS